jgi:glycosyltransferase involved in cell wall biosynthesis
MSDPRISFVVIGLNEAEHLSASIASLAHQGVGRDEMEVIYVDSGSTDGSPELAREAGVDKLLAIPRQTANAPRARNAGLARVRAPFVQFVDGDTQLEPGWAAQGLSALERDPELAGVEGDLVEARPDANLYHAVCELDWPAAAGPVDYVGGNSMYCDEPLRDVGGYDPDMRVGEEPELGVRLRAMGWRMEHLDLPMARHDIDIRNYSLYMRRSYTSGVACAMVARATGGATKGYWAERQWRALGYAAVMVGPPIIGVFLAAIAPAPGLLIALLGPLAFLALSARKTLSTWRQGRGPALSVAFGIHVYLSKLPCASGILSVLLRGGGRRTRASSS